MSIEFSTHAEILRLPQKQVALLPISYRKRYPTFAHWPSSTKTSEIPKAPSGLSRQSRVREPEIAHHKGRILDTQPRNNPRNVIDDYTESCGRVYALRYSHAQTVVVVHVSLVLKTGCCKDAGVDIEFVAELFLLSPKEVIRWFFWQIMDGFIVTIYLLSHTYYSYNVRTALVRRIFFKGMAKNRWN